MRSRDIIEHQVHSLVSLVQRWSAGGSADNDVKARIRDFVSMELLGRGNANVLVRALGALGDVEADLLQDMIHLCSQSFDRTDAAWNAFAVPVATQWHMQQNRIFVARRGQSQYLSELAAGIRQSVGAEKVVPDNAIYSAKSLYGLSAHSLHDHLQGLLTSASRLTRAPQTIELRSSSEPPWRMAYFLGVEVTKPGGRRQLNDPGVQDAVQGCLHWGVDALTKSEGQDSLESATPSKFEQGAFGATVCHPPLYLFDAIQFGEKALRGYRLQQLLQEMAKEDKQATLYYAFNPVCFAVDLLLKGRWLAYQMRWGLFAGEGIDEAVTEVGTAINAVNTDVRCQLVALELEALRDVTKNTAIGKYSLRRL